MNELNANIKLAGLYKASEIYKMFFHYEWGWTDYRPPIFIIFPIIGVVILYDLIADEMKKH